MPKPCQIRHLRHPRTNGRFFEALTDLVTRMLLQPVSHRGFDEFRHCPAYATPRLGIMRPQDRHMPFAFESFARGSGHGDIGKSPYSTRNSGTAHAPVITDTCGNSGLWRSPSRCP